MAQDATTLSALKIDLDLSDLDAAIARADRLKATLEQIKALQAEIGAAMQSARSDDDIDPKFGVPVRR